MAHLTCTLASRVSQLPARSGDVVLRAVSLLDSQPALCEQAAACDLCADLPDSIHCNDAGAVPATVSTGRRLSLALSLTFLIPFFTSIIVSLLQSNIMYWHDLLAFTLPAFLYLTTSVGLGSAIASWAIILIVASFLFGFIGLTAAHHDPRIFHDGDARRLDLDWGLYQLDSIIDRGDIKWSDLLVLTHFGEHALHHLFPTLDHGVLKQLYPELRETLKGFRSELREMNHWGHIKGQTKQLLRTTVNPLPQGSSKFE